MRSRFPGFLPYESAFKTAYRFRNPFSICKKFLRKRGEKLIDAYGETPLSVFAQIAQECSLSKDDVVIEMGCGRGLGAVFLSYLVGCRVIGIDWVPFFIETAKSILQTSFPSLPVTFHCQEMQCSDFSNATVIYLYGTCLPDEEIALLTRRFESLPTSVRIITVSYPLSDYTKNGSRIDSGLRELSRSPDPILEPFSVYSSSFCTIKQFSASFPWGEGEIYLNSLSDSKETLSSQPVESQK